jgi:hypothetical protein
MEILGECLVRFAVGLKSFVAFSDLGEGDNSFFTNTQPDRNRQVLKNILRDVGNHFR